MENINEHIRILRLNYRRSNGKPPKYLLMSIDCREILDASEYVRQMTVYSTTNRIESYEGMEMLTVWDKENFIEVVG